MAVLLCVCSPRKTGGEDYGNKRVFWKRLSVCVPGEDERKSFAASSQGHQDITQSRRKLECVLGRMGLGAFKFRPVFWKIG
ncbi:hypothetical protein CEXT_724071 [Caerostris extrusa]|uniref:Uncharacterized protein n=1 Tax=Caerostris extrusa TaxID=172846 RepID=A0AAV4QRC4_CAEEX|nr:hypothetical protein CEXT_724071 [Caerostris extrusa]